MSATNVSLLLALPAKTQRYVPFVWTSVSGIHLPATRCRSASCKESRARLICPPVCSRQTILPRIGRVDRSGSPAESWPMRISALGGCSLAPCFDRPMGGQPANSQLNPQPNDERGQVLRLVRGDSLDLPKHRNQHRHRQLTTNAGRRPKATCSIVGTCRIDGASPRLPPRSDHIRSHGIVLSQQSCLASRTDGRVRHAVMRSCQELGPTSLPLC